MKTAATGHGVEESSSKVEGSMTKTMDLGDNSSFTLNVVIWANNNIKVSITAALMKALKKY